MSEIEKKTEEEQVAEETAEMEETKEVEETVEVKDAEDEKEKKARRKRLRNRLLKIEFAIIGVMLLAYAGMAFYFGSHYMFNTSVNGTDYSLKSPEKAAEDMMHQVDGYSLTLEESDGDKEVINGSDIALEYVPTDELKQLVEAQNKFLWITSLWEKSELETKVTVQFDDNLLSEKIDSLACMDPENQVKSKNARPEFKETEFVVAEEIIGTQIKRDVFDEAVRTAITGFQYTLKLSETDCYKLPKYVSTSEEVIKACEKMNSYLGAEITLDFHPNKEVVDASVISQWISVNKNMKVTFSDEKMKEYLSELGKKYDTWGKDREFKTATGNVVTVKGGAYGWLLNEAEEYEQLKKDIKSGKKIEREPVFYSYAKAVEHTKTDWGNTYAEVDLTNQRMYFIKDGEVVLKSDIVTGNPNRGNATPQGIYSLTYKTKDAVLRGQRDENGKPEYETPVAYWMPFNGGIGFHDATWQSSFGGSRYLTNGSHGCVNMPKENAAKLYELIPDKCPVICHY